MTIQEIKTGDTFLVKGKSFLSRSICKVMKRWGKKNNYPLNFIFSHAATFVWIYDTLYLFGSTESGYKPLEFDKHYSWDKDEFAVMRRSKELSEEETNKTVRYVMHLNTVSLTYQYWNFFQWLLLVYLNINTFKKDSDDFTYCFESEMMRRKELNPSWYGDVYRTDIFQLFYDRHYGVIKIN